MSCCGFLTHIALIFGALLALIKLYNRFTLGWCKSQVCLVGKTAIVTGANSGVGYATALDFAKRGAKVILACRNQYRAEEARRKIIKETDNENVFVKIVDLTSFESVKQFAKEVLEEEDRLDILVNNAGVSWVGDQKTVNGLPLLMQVNHFSGFLLTNLLINLLKKSGSSRVVNVASYGAKFGTGFDLDNLIKHVDNNKDYFYSKLCNVLFTIELAKRLKGTAVTTYCLCPGLVDTEIFEGLSNFTKMLVRNRLAKYVFFKTCEEGAQTTIHCSVTKGIEKYSGSFFRECKERQHYESASDPELAKRLWQKSEEIVGVKFNI